MTYPLPRNLGARTPGPDQKSKVIDWLLGQKIAFSPIVYESYAPNPAYRNELMFVYFMAPADDPGVGEESNSYLRNVATWSVCMETVSTEPGMDGLGRQFGMPEKYIKRDYSYDILYKMAAREPALVQSAQAQAKQRSLDDERAMSIYLGFRRGHLIVFVRSAGEGVPPAGLSDCKIHWYQDFYQGEELK